MIYLGWGALYEGETDAQYYNALIPRVMTEIVLRRQARATVIPDVPSVRLSRGTVSQVAEEACRAADAFHLVFIHSDTGGRGSQETLLNRTVLYCAEMQKICGWKPVRCVAIAPRHETEAWVLADPSAIMAALGSRALPASLGLPADANQAEQLTDPKDVLTRAIRQASGRRRRQMEAKYLYSTIGEQQSLDRLRVAASFMEFEARLTDALVDVGCI